MLRQLVHMLGESITNTEELEYELVEYSTVVAALQAAFDAANSDGIACNHGNHGNHPPPHSGGQDEVCMSKEHFVASYLQHTAGTRYIAEHVFASMVQADEHSMPVGRARSVLILASDSRVAQGPVESDVAVCNALRSIVQFNDGDGGCTRREPTAMARAVDAGQIKPEAEGNGAGRTEL